MKSKEQQPKRSFASSARSKLRYWEPMKFAIPKDWTFKSSGIARGFDEHVREQLPWYDIATQAVAHLGRHYIPERGLVYDVGASTGNIGRALKDTLLARKCEFVAIEESRHMCEQYVGAMGSHYDASMAGIVTTLSYEDGTSERLICADALDYSFSQFDFCVCFLSLMFLPVRRRREFVNNLERCIAPGGALVIVDKVETPAGYAGTALRRLAMDWKMRSGVSADDILKKELSLAGYQRPIARSLVEPEGQVFFQLGEFVGWVIERRDA